MLKLDPLSLKAAKNQGFHPHQFGDDPYDYGIWL